MQTFFININQTLNKSHQEVTEKLAHICQLKGYAINLIHGNTIIEITGYLTPINIFWHYMNQCLRSETPSMRLEIHQVPLLLRFRSFETNF